MQVWIDSKGHAILNMVMGSFEDAFICVSAQLGCNGPNDGVEHTEVVKAVNEAFMKMDITSADLLLFIQDVRQF